MGGIGFHDGELVVERAPNELDRLAITFTEILDELDIRHVYVAGYVAVLTGRARSTQDVDVLLEPLDEAEVDRLVGVLEEHGMWWPAMPLADMYEMANEANIWIAPEGQVIPHIEAKFVQDESGYAALEDPLTARIDEVAVPVGPIELEIAYKLYLGSQKDFEDALHLFTLFEETLRRAELERWVEKLGVQSAYDRLKSA